ncbi:MULTISPECIES: hypothetical protein [Microbulbifer]|uniref:hypothetical protein n=1 Tax=Microbulbifer TaxID=48073 RepID=UPI001E4FFFDA|nr:MULTISPECIES: hypothetical protein [Microbulbifer]UHQ54653.1 hypothetical protein LVE68_14255 [Microbulbifer sp. YPW16]
MSAIKPLLVLLSPLLLSLACGSVYAVDVRLPGDRLLETHLAEARLVAELDGYAVIAGRSCIDCDENTSIYIQRVPRGRPGEGHGDNRETEVSISSDRFTYPGQYRDYLSKELVERTRLFYGRCYEGEQALLWLTEFRTGGQWKKEEYLIVFREDGPRFRYNRDRQPGRFHTSHEKCRELPGIDAETEP